MVDQGWIPARNVSSGSLLTTNDSDTVVVIHSTPRAPTTVYNLEIEDFHTYFAGAEAVWVHNSCGTRLPQYLKNKLNRIRNATAAGPKIAADGSSVARNLGVDGTVSVRDALKLGEAFVGPEYRTAQGGTILLSGDGLRQFRPAAEKFGVDWINGGIPFSKTGVQVNFQSRLIPTGEWLTNVHLDIIR